MFIQNKYYFTYFRLVGRAKSRIKPIEYCEKHHIIPKCLGGSNSKGNLALLTAREHYIAHLLLIRITDGKAKYQMVAAANAMLLKSKNHGRLVVGARQIALLREASAVAISVLTKGKPKHSAETRKRMSEAAMGRPSPNKGKTVSPEEAERLRNLRKGSIMPNHVKEAIIKANTGRKNTEETIAKRVASMRAYYANNEAKPLSENTKKAISQSLKGRQNTWGDKISEAQKAYHSVKDNFCSHCGRSFAGSTFKRWHGERCKLKT